LVRNSVKSLSQVEIYRIHIMLLVNIGNNILEKSQQVRCTPVTFAEAVLGTL